MSIFSLHAIGPLDGRYFGKTQSLQQYFSEWGLIKYRILVEVEYLIALSQENLYGLRALSEQECILLRGLYLNFSDTSAQRVKEIEQTTNHDVKAVEYFIKEEMIKLEMDCNLEFVHFGLTSQDINNTAIPLSMRLAHEEVILPEITRFMESMKSLKEQCANCPMLAKTHGQPASPTTLGKEIAVFIERFNVQLQNLKSLVFAAKFGGATGNFNAHCVAYPEKNWSEFGKRFVEGTLGLSYSFPTTQIEHYDHIAAYFHGLNRLQTVALDFCKDIWLYISMHYFKQKIVKGEIGSSAMPHKVNPIDFENAEGNLGISIAMGTHFAEKLPVSRLQRDLTDSTVLRNIGLPLGYLLVSLKSMQKGISKLEVDHVSIERDLEHHWVVLAEAYQTVLRREGVANPYEQLKDLTRKNTVIDKAAMHEFVDSLEVSDQIKEELKAITPFNYTGISN